MEKEVNKDVHMDNDKRWGVLAYIFFAIPLIFGKTKTNFIKYHTNQSIILFVVSIAGQIIFNALPHFIFFPLRSLFQLLMAILFVIGIVNVIKKQTKPLPVIGEWFTFLK